MDRFLLFLPISSDHVLDTLKTLNIDIQKSRGQYSDNVANMSGKYQGIQRRMKDGNELIDSVPCAAHLLKLIGAHSVSCCLEAINFFGLLNKLYAFFAESTHHWDGLTKGFTPNENQRIWTLRLSTT